jgi:hypothetical protein
MTVTLHCDDVIHWAETYSGGLFMSILCDPPYSLGNGTTGFMSSRWDTDVAFRPETWHALASHLHPGAFGACFASARGWHRLACAIEDAGLVLHPSVFMLGWLQASGWPKSTKIDQTSTRNGEGLRDSSSSLGYAQSLKNRCVDCGKAFFSGTPCQCPRPQSLHPFAGHRYGLQALKPAVEPILIWQKPYQHAAVEDITRTGAGALWIDGCRVANNGESLDGGGRLDAWCEMEGRTDRPQGTAKPNTPPSGRWPSNVSLIHTPACRPDGVQQVKGITGGREPIRRHREGWNLGYMFPDSHKTHYHNYASPDGTETVPRWVCAPDCPVAALEAQTYGMRASNPAATGTTFPRRHIFAPTDTAYIPHGHEDDGGPVSRFFPQFGWADDIAERLALADPMHYCPKASQAERSNGLPRGPEMMQLRKDLTPEQQAYVLRELAAAGVVL